MNDTATQQGAAHSGRPKIDPDVDTSKEIEVKMNPRDVALAAMADRQESMRTEELSEAIAADPGLAATQRAIEGEIAQANAEAGIVHKDTAPDPNDGAASREAMHKQPAQQPQDLPKDLQGDPLADFIVMNGAVPMVKAKVNGEERLIPLSDAKRQVQIGVAAEVRMQNAAQAEKILDERANKLTAGEAALSARMRTMQSQPAIPRKQPADLSDEVLEREANDIFSTAFSGTEEDAAKKLAKTLVKIRDSAAANVQPTQQIDAHAIAREAASIATGTLSAQDRKKDVSKGYEAFKENYPDIVSDGTLFQKADGLTEAIESEHPEWTISQVMDEAGKRTRAWVKDLTGQTQDTVINDPTLVPGDRQNSPVSEATTQTRQERKAGLVRMPTPAAGAQHTNPDYTGEVEQTPQDAFAEIKQARGQPY